MCLGILQTITKVYLLTNVLISLVHSEEEKPVFEDYGDYRYIFFKTTQPGRTWAQAEEECRKNNASLVTIKDESENGFLLSQIKSPAGVSYWIGITTLNQRDGYQWIDGTPIFYENWHSTLNHADRVKREKCVKIESVSGKWNHVNCDETAGSICKKRKEGKEVRQQLPITPPTGNCPLDWYQIENWPKCYKMMEKAENWTMAEQTCRSIGTNHDLMSIHDIAENMFLTSILTNDTWIGGVVSSDSESLIWSDKSTVDYNQLGDKISDMKGKCIQVLADELKAGIWEAISCSEERVYVCQRDRDPLIPVGPSVAPRKCFNDEYQFVWYRDACYLGMKDEEKSWIEGEEFCEKFGAHLASINDVYESAFIFYYLYPLAGDIWIGVKSEKGQFKWLSTWPLNYTKWEEGHPVNENKTLCVVLDSETQRWKVEDCESRHGFICKLTDDDPPEVVNPDEVCPDQLKGGLDLKGRYCYSVHESKTSWNLAQENCMKEKTTLASIHTIDELKLLGTHMKGLRDSWIGLRKGDDGIYKWVDGSLVDFVFWGKASEEEGAECVAISVSDLTWQATSCTQEKPFICGVPKVSVERPRKSKNGSKGLPSGAVAGIVIAVLIVLAGLACLAYYLSKNKLRR